MRLEAAHVGGMNHMLVFPPKPKTEHDENTLTFTTTRPADAAGSFRYDIYLQGIKLIRTVNPKSHSLLLSVQIQPSHP